MRRISSAVPSGELSSTKKIGSSPTAFRILATRTAILFLSLYVGMISIGPAFQSVGSSCAELAIVQDSVAQSSTMMEAAALGQPAPNAGSLSFPPLYRWAAD